LVTHDRYINLYCHIHLHRFSYKENKYDTELKIFQKKYFYLFKKLQIYDWNNYTVTRNRKSKKESRNIIRETIKKNK
jgi:hypothetical protein